MGFSLSHVLLVLVVVLIVFGAGKLPRMMADLAKGLKAFREGMKDEETPLLTNKSKKDKASK